MKRNDQIHFGDFRLDAANQELFHGGEKIHMRPKTFAVLQYLAEHPGQTVTKNELSQKVWPEGGGDDVIKCCVHEIRATLDDDKNKPRIIETRPRIGYRFVAEVRTQQLHLQLTNFVRPGSCLVQEELEEEVPLPFLPDTLKSLLEAYCYALKAKCFGEASQMFLNRQLGESLFWHGHYALAAEIMDPLIQAHLNRGWEAPPEALANLYMLSGMIEAKSNNTKQAAVQFQKAVDASNPDQAFIPAGYLTEVKAESGRFYEAFEVLERAKTLEEFVGIKGSYRITGRQGYINAAVGKVEDAKRQLAQAIEASRGEDPSYLCLYLRVRGDMHTQMGRKDEALGDYSQALEIALAHGFKDYEGHILRGLGDLYRLHKDPTRSAEKYSAALAIANETGYLWLGAETRIGQARLAIENSDFERASSEASQALKIAGPGGWLVQEIQAHLAHAKISALRGLGIEARTYTEIARGLIAESGHYWSRKQLE